MSNVLVIEDHRDSAELLIVALQQAGYAVEYAADGRRALDRVSSHTPDLIVLDLRLPVLDGIGFMRVLRSYLRWQHIPVIVVSAGTDTELDHVMQLGARGVFRKAQFKLKDFLDAVHQALAPPPDGLDAASLTH